MPYTVVAHPAFDCMPGYWPFQRGAVPPPRPDDRKAWFGQNRYRSPEFQVFVTLWRRCLAKEARSMSENYRLYAEKEAAKRAARMVESHPLRPQLEELLLVVRRCERMWEIEERVEKSL